TAVVIVAIVDWLSLCVRLDCVQPMSICSSYDVTNSILALSFKTRPSLISPQFLAQHIGSTTAQKS
ncbi:MAG TPA: hypothetical protein V6D19_03950, partial [Stenomitos sp.]